MKKFVVVILVIGIVFAIWIDKTYSSPRLDITAEYSNGKIITNIYTKNINDITSMEIRYKTDFLDQYINVNPEVVTYSFPNYIKSHTLEIWDGLLQGKKDQIEVEVAVTFDKGTQELTEKVNVKDIKEKIYNDFVIEPEFINDNVHYNANGLIAVIDKDSYDKDIVFYSNPNYENANISVGFEKDYTLYSLNSFGVLSENEALEKNYKGFSLVEFTKEEGVDESFIVVEYGMIDLTWDGLYPYDLDGNEILYESKDGSINLFANGKATEISQSSYEKYKEMKDKIPNIKFIMTKKIQDSSLQK